jgi:type IV pilus assembly protein PilF
VTKSDRRLAGLAAFLLLAGCVSTTTTTGDMPPEANESNAADLNYQLGARYYKNGNYDLARDRLLYSIKLDPHRAITYSTLGLTYEALENQRLAKEAYEKAIRVEPRNADALNTYAVYLCRQGEYDEAPKYFDRAVRIPDNDNSYVMLTNAGVCMEQKPDLEKAEEYFREALNRKSNYGEALIQMCALKHSTDDNLHARAFMQRYLATNPPTAAVLYLAMQIEQGLGNERAETEYSNRLLREFPTSPEARHVLESDKK